MIKVHIAGEEIVVEAGTTLQEICDEHAAPVDFGCRAAECGACMIQIVDGAENLSPVRPDEQGVLDVLARSADCRLACQITVLGPVIIEVAD